MGSDEPLVPFRVQRERERHHVSDLKNEVAELKIEVSGLIGQVDSLDRKVTQMSGTIDEMNQSLRAVLSVVARLQPVD